MEIELEYLIRKVRYAKEILGAGHPDCAYQANKVLEVVVFRLQELNDLVTGQGDYSQEAINKINKEN